MEKFADDLQELVREKQIRISLKPWDIQEPAAATWDLPAQADGRLVWDAQHSAWAAGTAPAAPEEADAADVAETWATHTPADGDSSSWEDYEVAGEETASDEAEVFNDGQWTSATATETLPAEDELLDKYGMRSQQPPLEAVVMGLRPAPAEYGAGSYIATPDQLDEFVERRVQKIRASLKALKRYTEEVEQELQEKEAKLDDMQMQLDEERVLRAQAEAELAGLQQQKATLEATVVENQEVQNAASLEVDNFLVEAERLTEQVRLGEISEEEAARLEDELLRAEARRLAGHTSQKSDELEFSQVSVATEEAARRAAEAAETEAKLRQEVEELRAAVERTKGERDEEVQKRIEADGRLTELIQRIQARAARGA